MYDYAHKAPGCVIDPPYDPNMCGFNDFPGCTPLNGCGSDGIFPFISIFYVLTAYCLLNVFVGVILTEFGIMDSLNLSADELELFIQHWMEYDHFATCTIPVEMLEEVRNCDVTIIYLISFFFFSWLDHPDD